MRNFVEVFEGASMRELVPKINEVLRNSNVSIASITEIDSDSNYMILVVFVSHSI
jgi:hypothetical protein